MKTSKLIITTIIFLALMSLVVPHGSCLDVSCRAIKARQSDEYSPNTAWELGYTGKGITIAVLDTGIDDRHKSLSGQWIAGVDTTTTGENTPKDGSYNPQDTYGHGTYVAGIALGRDSEYMGVAPDAKLIDVKIYRALEAEYQEHEDDAIEGFEWCINHKDTDWSSKSWNAGLSSEYKGIDVISLSVGVYNSITDGNDAWSREIDKAVDNGIVVVYATADYGPDNEGMTIPCPDKGICVGASDDKNTINRDDDEIANFSSRGPRDSDGDNDPYDELKPDVVAPGVNIMAPMPKTLNQFYPVSGTSFSTPHVAGVVALMLEANSSLAPEEVKQILLETAEQHGTPEYPDYPFPYNKWNKTYGCGIVDAYAAVKRVLGLSPSKPNVLPSISITSPKNNAKVSDTITISGSASDPDGNVTNFELKFDDNNWLNVSIFSANSLEWNYTWNTKDVANGKHTISARCFDAENWSAVQSIDVNVYNKATGGEEEIKINPTYLISAAGIIGAVVIVVVCLLLFRRKRLAGLPASVPLQPAIAVPSTVTIPPPPVTAVPSVSAQCQNCGNIIKITSAKRPLTVKCPKCGTKGMLR